MASGFMPKPFDFDVAIVHRNRVCGIHLCLTISQLQLLASMMQEPFPVLTHLKLESLIGKGPDLPLPDEFLGGSAPRLQSLGLNFIPFPALPKLLLSATDLVRLVLWGIPDSGYIAPEAILTGLAVLANLKFLTIGFEFSVFFPDQEHRHPPLLTRSVLPALAHFEFRGASRYLDALVSQIDAPLLASIYYIFPDQYIFDTSHLAQFFRRTTRFQALNEAHVYFDFCNVLVNSFPPTQPLDEKSGLRISYGGDTDHWDILHMAQFLTSLFPSIYIVEHLYFYGYQLSHAKRQWREGGDVDEMDWLEVFHPFTTVKKFYICEESAQRIAPALQELPDESMVSLLPALESLFLECPQQSGPVQEVFDRFVSARWRFGHPVTVSHWEGDPRRLRDLRGF